MKHTTLTLLTAVAFSTASMSAYADNNWQDSAKDAWIDGKAESTLLFNTNLNSFDIDTDVKDGTVILQGEVATSVDKALAEELVASLDGVSKVDNKLRVVDESQDDETSETMQLLKDSKVESVVKTRLLFESEVSGLDIDVDVKDGVVTLTGVVESDAERDLAVAIAKNTHDVKDVVSHIELSS
jgi:hyperosmotically inducible periplasmic protein